MYGSERLCFYLEQALLGYARQGKTKLILKQDILLGNGFFHFLILKGGKEKLRNIYLKITETKLSRACFSTVLDRVVILFLYFRKT